MIDTHCRFSAFQFVQSTSLDSSILAIENHWLSSFWSPNAIQGHLGFKKTFQQYLKKYNILFRPTPTCRHYKNLLEPKHGVIRAIYILLKSTSPSVSPTLNGITAMRISNELYGSDTLSSFEISKEYSKTVDQCYFPTSISEKLVHANDDLK